MHSRRFSIATQVSISEYNRLKLENVTIELNNLHTQTHRHTHPPHNLLAEGMATSCNLSIKRPSQIAARVAWQHYINCSIQSMGVFLFPVQMQLCKLEAACGRLGQALKFKAVEGACSHGSNMRRELRVGIYF